MMPSAAQLRAVSMTENEYRRCRDMLGRAPNEVELGIFGALWSEHCGYKHSHALLKRLPSRSPRMLVGAGEENAGVVDIGEGLACVFKIESHNHPSAVEPFEGAATGVGGIIRDIFTMGPGRSRSWTRSGSGRLTATATAILPTASSPGFPITATVSGSPPLAATPRSTSATPATRW